MKPLIRLFVLVMMASLCQNAEAFKLKITTTDNVYYVDIRQIKDMIFPNDGTVLVITADATYTFSENEMKSFTESDADAIPNVTANPTTLYIRGNDITSPYTGITIYDLKGAKRLSTTTNTLSMAKLTKGTYLIKSGPITVKVTKK
ncbi:MAG: hypothetical protein LIO90_04145 [Bacteroidales bacterium]|nr:hypothetical protein [Bacteroidales bacterium]